MRHSDEAFAMMLLTMTLSPMGDGGVKPLSLEELGALAGKIDVSGSNRLGTLLGMDMFGMQRLLNIDEEASYRLYLLLNREMPLGRLIDDCADRGTEIITPFDQGYPKAVIDRLGVYQSPALFVQGNLALFDEAYIGVLGIPGIRTTDEMKSGIEQLIVRSALCGFGLVTGEEAGVCRVAAGYALENDCRLICALTGGFDDYTSDVGHSHAISNGNLLALSISHPATKSNPLLAPTRNKLIFTLGGASFVLTTDGRRGEVEAVKKKLCDYMYVLCADNLPQNAALKQKGFTELTSLEKLDIEKLAPLWSEPGVQQLSFL